MQFSQTFKALCKNKGVSQKQALQEMGMNRNAVQPWSQGMPGADALKKISEYFGVSMDSLLGVEQQKNPVTENGNGISEVKSRLLQKVMQMSDEELQKLELLFQIVESK